MSALVNQGSKAVRLQNTVRAQGPQHPPWARGQLVRSYFERVYIFFVLGVSPAADKLTRTLRSA